MLILVYSAQIHYQSQILYRTIISDLSVLKVFSAQSEEFLILLKHFKFRTKTFGAFDLSFATFGKVRLNLKPTSS